jgi:hypothetical protein
MSSPFPSMDPNLERSHVWPDVHTALIVATRDALLAYCQPPEPLLSPQTLPGQTHCCVAKGCGHKVSLHGIIAETLCDGYAVWPLARNRP